MEAVLEAVKRTTTGKNENNRTRAAGQCPAVIYGAQKAGDAIAPLPVSVDPKPFLRILHSKSGMNTLITLKVDGETDAQVLVKEVQLDPITHAPLHADFYRVNLDRTIEVTVPIVLKGESRGVKVEGGILDFLHREIVVETLPNQIPNSIEVDVSAMGIGDAIHLRDVLANVTWTPVTDPDTMLVHVVALKAAEAAAEAGPAAAAEPEVAKKGKTDKPEEKAGDKKAADKKPDAKKK
ncbi:MAG: 50S ribosomal protein L25 [Acidobacteria bacterium]|nr:50S ribosomal protein L25 [Acidobacteriota bacterium]